MGEEVIKGARPNLYHQRGERSLISMEEQQDRRWRWRWERHGVRRRGGGGEGGKWKELLWPLTWGVGGLRMWRWRREETLIIRRRSAARSKWNAPPLPLTFNIHTVTVPTVDVTEYFTQVLLILVLLFLLHRPDRRSHQRSVIDNR